jgi:glutamine synthetase
MKHMNAKTARLICSVYMADNKTPFEGDPRNILQKVIDEAKDMGYGFNVGPECEFFLFKTDENGKPLPELNDEAGYFDLNPIDHGENCRRDICLALEDMGYTVEASHHEAAPGQHEIDFKFGEVMTTADRVMTFKHVVKTYATKHGLHATFMPKPICGINGSGMHTNMSLYDLKTGKNVFDDPSGELGLSKEAFAFIAGTLEHVKGITAFANPTVNSYKRLVPGYEAPSYLTWSTSNRSVLVRIPASRGQGTRIELRSPDPTCNPYLEMALCLAAGLDGIKRGLVPQNAHDENIYALSKKEKKKIEHLPTSLKEAVKEAQADTFIHEVLGDHIFDNYIAGKKAEWNEYRRQVSQWEIDRYMINY